MFEIVIHIGEVLKYITPMGDDSALVLGEGGTWSPVHNHVSDIGREGHFTPFGVCSYLVEFFIREADGHNVSVLLFVRFMWSTAFVIVGSSVWRFALLL